MNFDANLIRNLVIIGFAVMASGLVYAAGSTYRERLASIFRARTVGVRRSVEVEVEQTDLRMRAAAEVRKRGLEGIFGIASLRRKLIQSGERGNDAVDKVIFAKLMMPAAGFFSAYQFDVAGFFVNPRNEYAKLLAFLISSAIAIAVFYVPDLLLNLEIKKRQDAIRSAFSETADLLFICVQAGMSFEQAINRVTKEIGIFSPEMQDEFTILSAELSYLSDKRKALQNLRERVQITEIENFVLVIQQAERYGTALGEALRVMSAEARQAKMTMLEKKALSLPPKLAVPITFFILPGIVSMVFAPMVLGGFPLD